MSPALPDYPAITAQSVVVRAPAKLNPHLAVGPLDPVTGYHDLATVYLALALYDEVIVTPGDAGITVQIHTPNQTEVVDVPLDANNLVHRAATAVAKYAAVPEPNIDLTIVKRIPVAAGLAGGSADAAATLLACDALWGTHLTHDEFLTLAAGLGADVPFSFHGGVAIGEGHGEALRPVTGDVPQTHWVLAISEEALSTPTVFAECDRLRGDCEVPEPVIPAETLAALQDPDPTALAAVLANDLQEPACHLVPQLRQVLAAGPQLGALGSIISGSGPTIGFLAQDADHAQQLATTLAGLPGVRALTTTHGPVPGATIIQQPTG